MFIHEAGVILTLNLANSRVRQRVKAQPRAISVIQVQVNETSGYFDRSCYTPGHL